MRLLILTVDSKINISSSQRTHWWRKKVVISWFVSYDNRMAVAQVWFTSRHSTDTDETNHKSKHNSTGILDFFPPSHNLRYHHKKFYFCLAILILAIMYISMLYKYYSGRQCWNNATVLSGSLNERRTFYYCITWEILIDIIILCLIS